MQKNIFKQLPFDDHGWLSKNNQEMLAFFFEQYDIQTVIEIGTWLGKSAFFMAKMLPEDGRLYAIDHWQGDGFIKMHGRHNERLENLYHRFLSNLYQVQLENKIIPIRMNSQEAVQAIDVGADLIYIDASHKEKDVYQDILAWWKKLNPNGILCGDDYKWKSVQNATQKAAKELGVQLKNKSPFWWFEPRNTLE
jgi:predicted O-methyltransferase YrrM